MLELLIFFLLKRFKLFYLQCKMAAEKGIPSIALDAVLKKSSFLPEHKEVVKGYDFNEGIDYHAILQSYKTTGFQATNFGLAVEEINKMVCIFLFF